jgi:hypothetical protein
MALLEEQFTETLDAGAPDITYEGNEGREQQIAQALWDKLPPQVRMQFGSFQQFFSSGAWKKMLQMLQQQMQGQEGPQEVQDPILQQEGQAVQEQGMGNQGIGGLMPQPQPMGMAYGGTPGADGRQAYGIGSWFQKKIMDPIKKNIKPIAAVGAGLALNKWGLPGVGESGHWGKDWIGTLKKKAGDFLGSETWKGSGGEDGGGGLRGLLTNPNFLIPAAGLFAGTFAKKDEPGYTGQGTGLNLQDIGRVANITDPKTAMASGLRFSPDLETRKFTPEEMLQSYAATDAKDFSTPGAAYGGRIGYAGGGILNMLRRLMTPEAKRFKKFNYSQGITDDYKMDTTEIMEEMAETIYGKPYSSLTKKQQMKIFDAAGEERANIESLIPEPDDFAQGGRIRAQEGGLMDLGGMEKDYRNDGGFVPIGGEEKADDVPARLSRNEFVFTADAVRNAGAGDMDRGAEVMENVMKNLEGGGKISAESQGKGAGEMFEVSERLSEVV